MAELHDQHDQLLLPVDAYDMQLWKAHGDDWSGAVTKQLERYAFAITADGRSSNSGTGYKASRFAISEITSYLIEALPALDGTASSLENGLSDTVRNIEADENFKKTSGTTLDVMIVDRQEKKAYLFHIGDGFMFLIRPDGTLEQKTKPEGSSASGPTYFLGRNGGYGTHSFQEVPLANYAGALLCTDGFLDTLTIRFIQERILRNNTEPARTYALCAEEAKTHRYRIWEQFSTLQGSNAIFGKVKQEYPGIVRGTSTTTREKLDDIISYLDTHTNSKHLQERDMAQGLRELIECEARKEIEENRDDATAVILDFTETTSRVFDGLRNDVKGLTTQLNEAEAQLNGASVVFGTIYSLIAGAPENKTGTPRDIQTPDSLVDLVEQVRKYVESHGRVMQAVDSIRSLIAGTSHETKSPAEDEIYDSSHTPESLVGKVQRYTNNHAAMMQAIGTIQSIVAKAPEKESENKTGTTRNVQTPESIVKQVQRYAENHAEEARMLYEALGEISRIIAPSATEETLTGTIQAAPADIVRSAREKYDRLDTLITTLARGIANIHTECSNITVAQPNLPDILSDSQSQSYCNTVLDAVKDVCTARDAVTKSENLLVTFVQSIYAAAHPNKAITPEEVRKQAETLDGTIIEVIQQLEENMDTACKIIEKTYYALEKEKERVKEASEREMILTLVIAQLRVDIQVAKNDATEAREAYEVALEAAVILGQYVREAYDTYNASKVTESKSLYPDGQTHGYLLTIEGAEHIGITLAQTLKDYHENSQELKQALNGLYKILFPKETFDKSLLEKMREEIKKNKRGHTALYLVYEECMADERVAEKSQVADVTPEVIKDGLKNEFDRLKKREGEYLKVVELFNPVVKLITKSDSAKDGTSLWSLLESLVDTEKKNGLLEETLKDSIKKLCKAYENFPLLERVIQYARNKQFGGGDTEMVNRLLKGHDKLTKDYRELEGRLDELKETNKTLDAQNKILTKTMDNLNDKIGDLTKKVEEEKDRTSKAKTEFSKDREAYRLIVEKIEGMIDDNNVDHMGTYHKDADEILKILEEIIDINPGFKDRQGEGTTDFQPQDDDKSKNAEEKLRDMIKRTNPIDKDVNAARRGKTTTHDKGRY